MIAIPLMGGMINLPVNQYYPGDVVYWITTNVVSLGTIDAIDEKVGQVVSIRHPKPIRGIVTQTQTITTGGTLRYSIETIGPTGVPTGNLYCANSSGTIVIASADDNIKLASNDMVLDCDISTAAIVAVVFTHLGDSFAGAPIAAGTSMSTDFVYTVSSNSTSGYTKGTAGPELFLLKHNDGTHSALSQFAFSNAYSAITYNNTSTSKEIGQVFLNMPFSGILDSVAINFDVDSNANINVWKNKTIFESISISSSTDADITAGYYRYRLRSEMPFFRGDDLMVTVAPQTSTNLTIYNTQIYSGSTMIQTALYGDRVYYSSSSTLGGTWDQFQTDNTKKCFINLGLSGIDYGSYGGSSGVSQ